MFPYLVFPSCQLQHCQINKFTLPCRLPIKVWVVQCLNCFLVCLSFRQLLRLPLILIFFLGLPWLTQPPPSLFPFVCVCVCVCVCLSLSLSLSLFFRLHGSLKVENRPFKIQIPSKLVFEHSERRFKAFEFPISCFLCIIFYEKACEAAFEEKIRGSLGSSGRSLGRPKESRDWTAHNLSKFRAVSSLFKQSSGWSGLDRWAAMRSWWLGNPDMAMWTWQSTKVYLPKYLNRCYSISISKYVNTTNIKVRD